MKLTYKIGDKVIIKSLGWYNKNKNEYDNVTKVACHFVSSMKIHCGKSAIITDIKPGKWTFSGRGEKSCPTYKINIDPYNYNWTKGMFENIKKLRRKKLKKIKHSNDI